MTALMIDLDGVLYEGERALPGAADAVSWLEQNGIAHVFVTNTTSRPRSALVGKLSAMGLKVDAEHILTPPVAAKQWLSEQSPGEVALFADDSTREDFAPLSIAGPEVSAVDSVVIGDYAERWTYDELNRAFRLLMAKPQPVLIALGMTRFWKAEDGLRLDTAPFVSALSHATGIEPVVLGKPAKPFFQAALAVLGARSDDVLMIGDDIRGDIGGAQASGIRAAQVRTGKFRESDLDGDIHPDIILDSIADLPGCWAECEAHLRAPRADPDPA